MIVIIIYIIMIIIIIFITINFMHQPKETLTSKANIKVPTSKIIVLFNKIKYAVISS